MVVTNKSIKFDHLPFGRILQKQLVVNNLVVNTQMSVDLGHNNCYTIKITWVSIVLEKIAVPSYS